MTRRCDCGILLDHDGPCGLCGPRIPQETVLLIAGRLLSLGDADAAAFEAAEAIAYDLDARGLLAAPPCEFCGRPGGTHDICRLNDQRISELERAR